MGLIFNTLLLFSFLFNSSLGNDPKYSKYYGITYRSLNEIKEFSKFKDIGGALIGEKLPQTDFGISHYSKGPIDLIVFEKIITSAQGKVSFRLLDILEIRGLKKDQGIAYGTCRKDGKPDCEIIAIYKYEDSEYFKNVIKAWRANRKTGQIEPADIQGVDCINDSWGVD